MAYTLGFSPCPNDTFIFDAMVNGLIDIGGLEFEPIMQDVETLNQLSLEGRMDITKLSYAVLPQVQEHYILLNSGSALGKGCGPLLIGKDKEYPTIEDQSVAIPGQHTTAHLLFTMAYPNARKKIFIRYDQIEEFVLQGKGLGVIIHENRFTYDAKGLHKITDLGDYWEKETGSAIPLGGIVMKRSIDKKIQLQVEQLIRQSVRYAFAHHYQELSNFVKMNAQEMETSVMRQHIDLYVNDYTVDLGTTGQIAVKKLVEQYHLLHPETGFPTSLFLRS